MYILNTPHNIQNIHLYHIVPIKHPIQYTKHTSIPHLYLLNTPCNIQNIHVCHIVPIRHPIQYTKHTSISQCSYQTPHTIYKTYIYVTLYILNTPCNIQDIRLYHIVPIKLPIQYTKHTSMSHCTYQTPHTIYKRYIYITLYILNTPYNIQSIHLYHIVPIRHPIQYTKHTCTSHCTY